MCLGWARTRSSQRAHRGVGREVELPLVRDVRVRVERDVGDRVALADEEAPAREVRLHHAERRVAARDLVGELRAVLLDEAEVVPGAHHRDVRLVAVLLEEQPLQHLRARELVVRQERRALGEVELDRVRLPQVGAVLEPDAGDAPVRVLREELGGARLPLAHDVQLNQLVGDAELGQEQAHLVAVPGDQSVVESQHARLNTAPGRTAQTRTSRVSR